jgi:hypothetical protein
MQKATVAVSVVGTLPNPYKPLEGFDFRRLRKVVVAGWQAKQVASLTTKLSAAESKLQLAASDRLNCCIATKGPQGLQAMHSRNHSHEEGLSHRVPAP